MNSSTSSVDTLREAFPSVEVSVIDDVLYSTKGDLNAAFDILLDMNVPDSDRLKPLPAVPPLPSRRASNNSNNMSSRTATPRISPPRFTENGTNPFLDNRSHTAAKPLTVREELAQWRQDLREESRRRASSAINSAASSPNLSFSNIFRSNSSRPSLQGQQGHQRSSGNVSSIRYSASTPHINQQMHSRSNSQPNTAGPLMGTLNSSRSTEHARPSLPNRRQSSISSTNPFYVRPVPPIPVAQQAPHSHQDNSSQHRSSSENDVHSFNPFEEPELPPPAYSEIQRDTIVNLS